MASDLGYRGSTVVTVICTFVMAWANCFFFFFFFFFFSFFFLSFFFHMEAHIIGKTPVAELLFEKVPKKHV